MAKFGQKPVVENEDDDESVVAIKIPDINDVPITALNFRYHPIFLLLCWDLFYNSIFIGNLKKAQVIFLVFEFFLVYMLLNNKSMKDSYYRLLPATISTFNAVKIPCIFEMFNPHFQCC